MPLTPATEDYLKTVWQLATTGTPASPSALARRLGVSAPSVSAMVDRLVRDDLLARSDSREVVLTPAGEVEALRVVRRHRLLETFLVDVVGLEWDEVHGEAEILEHVLSPRLEERIDRLLGHPTHDPHGDPIPPRTGRHDERWADPITSAPSGSRFRVERVSDTDAGALRHLAALGIRPGVELAVGDQEPYGGPLWVTLPGHAERTALGEGLVRLLHGQTVTAP